MLFSRSVRHAIRTEKQWKLNFRPLTFKENSFIESTKTDSISTLIEEKPALQNCNKERIEDVVKMLETFNFKKSDCIEIISKNVQVLQLSNLALKETLVVWTRSDVTSDYLRLLIINNPQFLFPSAKVLERQLPPIQGFVKKPKSLIKLLLRNPTLLTEKWDFVQAKIDYILGEMLVPKEELINSSALTKSLDHIRLRHTLLLKCGLYIPPSKYEHKRNKNAKSTFRNPHLKRIVDNEDISFARKICKISREEYEVYKVMFEDGYLSDKEKYSDSDSDSDSDEE